MSAKRLGLLLGVVVIVAISAFIFLNNDDGEEGEDEDKVYRVAILDESGIATIAFRDELGNLGYREGENIVYITPSADAEDPIATVMAENPDVVFCVITQTCVAAQQAAATSETPIVFMLVSDPIGAGLITDFTEPGGYVTGVVSVVANSVNEGRRFEWLIEIDPTIERVLIFYDPTDPTVAPKLAIVQSTAESLGIELVYQEVTTPEEVDEGIANLPDDVQGLFTFSQRVFTVAQLTDLAQAAIAKNMRFNAPGVETGALVSYSSDIEAMSRQSATMVDKILRGADPASTPVESPEFFLSVNLITAEAIGVQVPNEVLNQADTIIRPE